jgi:hypothetical protein
MTTKMHSSNQQDEIEGARREKVPEASDNGDQGRFAAEYYETDEEDGDQKKSSSPTKDWRPSVQYMKYNRRWFTRPEALMDNESDEERLKRQAEEQADRVEMLARERIARRAAKALLGHRYPDTENGFEADDEEESDTDDCPHESWSEGGYSAESEEKEAEDQGEEEEEDRKEGVSLQGEINQDTTLPAESNAGIAVNEMVGSGNYDHHRGIHGNSDNYM